LKRSNRLILLIGIFLAVVAFVGIILLIGQDGPSDTGRNPTPPPDLPTVIATQDIALGVTITEAMVTTEVMPQTARLSGAFQDPSQVIGKIVRQSVKSGGQITSGTFSTGSGSQIRLEVPLGQRAMSLQIDAVNGVGTIIQTGDYVDMVLGLTGDAFPVVEVNPVDNSIQVVAGLNNTSVKLVLEGMQVLGVVRQTTAAATPPPNAAVTPSPSAGTPTVTESSTALVILSVTAQQAEVIKFAQLQGNISLVLRSSLDFFDENGEPLLPIPAGTTGVILKTLVDGGYGVLRPELVEAILPAQEN
jgi:Flp pilus assembly protein CpaB